MKKLLAIGDSHLDSLQAAADLGLLRSDESVFCIVPGATAVGLRNPNSITNAISLFRVAAQGRSKTHRVLIHLGEVDCGFVMWWRQAKYGEPIESQLHQSISAYKSFVIELLEMGYESICITGASLPTIRDGVDFGNVANKRSEISVSLKERTLLTQQYNSALLTIASEFGCSYFDLSEAFVDFRTGVVSDFFRHTDPCDHHLDPSKVVGVWALACNKNILC
ncbi:hypothetical protein [Pseudomonas farris]